MHSQREIVIGIDGGGTHTRVMVSDLNGHILSYVENGASSVKKDKLARQNVQQAMIEALSRAGCHIAQVKGIAAGIAGLDSEDDLDWVRALTDVPGLSAPSWHVNDAVIAHVGAFLAEPGIVVISGTGSILFAITEEGTPIRNYDLHHYAASAARFLSYDAVFEILAGNGGSSDEVLIRQVLAYWGVADLAGLRNLAMSGFIEDRRERDRMFGRMAPLVTSNAAKGSRLAQFVCDKAIHQISVGVQLLGAYFTANTVPVAFVGSVVNSPYMKRCLTDKLATGKNKKYVAVEPALSTVAGAVVMALKRLEVPVTDETIRNIQRHPYSLYPHRIESDS